MNIRDMITVKSFFLSSCFLVGIVFGLMDKDNKEVPIPKSDTLLNIAESVLASKEEIKGIRIPLENDRGGYSVIKAEEVTHRYCDSIEIKGVNIEEFPANSRVPYSSMSSDFGLVEFDGFKVTNSRFWGNLQYTSKNVPDILTKTIDKESYVKIRRSHSVRNRQASISISEK
jgi:hypothetical protein